MLKFIKNTFFRNKISKKDAFVMLVITAAISGLILSYSFWPIKIEHTHDNSLPYHWWITVEYEKGEDKGKVVEIDNYFKDKYTHYAKSLVKVIRCDEGERLEVKEKEYYCNGELIGKAVWADRLGVPINNFVFNGVIPDNQAFVLGTHYRSYDSRYLGFINKSKIVREFRALNGDRFDG